MNDDRVVSIGSQTAPCDPLTELLREKAVELLQAAAPGSTALLRKATQEISALGVH
jgi:hypothetical protein